MNPQTSTSRSRPAGGVEEKLPASAPAGGIRRSSRVRSNVDSALPATGGSRKASNVEAKSAIKVSTRRGPGAAARRGSQEDPVVEQWGLRGPRESAATYGSRIAAKLSEYEQLGKKLKGLRDDLSFARHRASTAPKKQKPELSAKVKSLQQEIKDLELQRMVILEGSDVFKEKLLNEGRFAKMKSPKREEEEEDGGDCSADGESSSEEEGEEMEAGENDVEDKTLVTESVEDLAIKSQPAQGIDESQLSLPAGQVALPISSGEGSGDDDSGGALLAQIARMESPLHMENFSFGDDLGKEELIKGKKKSRKTAEQVNLVYVPFVQPGAAEKSSQGVDTGNLTVPASVTVEQGQKARKSTTKMAKNAGLTGQSSEVGNGVGAAGGPDSMAAEVTCLQPGDTAGHSSAGEGRSVIVPAVGTLPGRSGSKTKFVGGPSDGSGAAGRSSAGRGRSVRASREGTSVSDEMDVGSSQGGLRAAGRSSAGEGRSAHKSPVGGVSGLLSVPAAAGHCPVGGVCALRTAEASPEVLAAGGGASNKETVTMGGASLVHTNGHGHSDSQDSQDINKAMLQAVQEIEAEVLAEVEGKTGGNAESSQVSKGNAAAKSNVPRDAKDATTNASTTSNKSGSHVIKPARLQVSQSSPARQEVFIANVTSVSSEVVGGSGSGPAAPPAVGSPVRSYANATAGGTRGSSSLNPGEGNLQRRLLEALRRGDRTLQVEGREVNLSFWVERHGLGAFREHNGEVVWSLPTGGQESGRRNVVRLVWRGSDACPSRAKVVELLFKMGFRANDIFALIHPYGTSEFDISFVKPEGLELFWSNHELVKNKPEWRGFDVKAVSRQSSVKKVTVLTRNESLSCYDIMTWLGRYGEVMDIPKKNLDEHGIWSGAWTFSVRLRRSGNTVAHIPSAAFLGRDRIQVFYQGQPKLCHRCGDPTHFSANCTKQVCALCGAEGHLAATCESQIRCHLCGDLGHAFSRCPRSFSNAAAAQDGESLEVASSGEGTSRGEGALGPVKRLKNKSPSKLRREERRRRSSDLGSSLVAGVVDGSAPDAGSETIAEALEDTELDKEIRRLRKEEAKRAISSSSSQYESLDEDGGKGQDEKRRCNSRRQGQKGPKASSSSSSVAGQVPKESLTDPPLIVLSNRYQALGEGSSLSLEGEVEGPILEAVEPPGGAEPVSSRAVSLGGKVAPGSGDEDLGMDMSASLKRAKEKARGSSSDGEGGNKKGRK